MNLERVTITGADDSTSIPELVDLSTEFPFVEWGILVSHSQEGGCRFPSRHWMDRFSQVVKAQRLSVATHICGRWVRQILTGDLVWSVIPSCFQVSRRIQINTHAQRHNWNQAAIASLPSKDCQFIFQLDDVNDVLPHVARSVGINTAGLFDLSHGAGLLPESWPIPRQEFPCGYAGGLGPDNVAEQIKKIEAVCQKPYWIDMERRVRTEDDSALDTVAVRSVLQTVKDLGICQ